MFNLLVEEGNFKGLPYIHISPRGGGHSTMVYYHGWNSSAESSIFRGKILASFGFDTYLPDALYHGRRRSPDHSTEGEVDWNELFKVIERNRQEFQVFYDQLKGEKIYLAGHSMGAMTTGSILATYPVQGALSLNGAFDFSGFARFYGAQVDSQEVLNPMDRLDQFKDKTLFLGNGREDTTVLAPYQESFYHALGETGQGPWTFQVFEGTGHVVTTNMLEGGLDFLFQEDPHLSRIKKNWTKEASK